MTFRQCWSKYWWTPLFEEEALALCLPPLQPLNFLFNPNSLILFDIQFVFVELLSEIDDMLVGKLAWQKNIRTYFVSISVSVIVMFAVEGMFWSSFVPEEFSSKTN